MYCEVCDVSVEDDQTWAAHLSGEMHVASLEALGEGTGIFIKGFDKGLQHNHLKAFFDVFGKVEEVILNKKMMFAIIEFRHRKSAELVLSREIFLQGRKLKIVPRKGKPRLKKLEKTPLKNAPNSSSSMADGNNKTSTKVCSTNPFRSAFDLQAYEFVKKIEAADIEIKIKMLCQSLEKFLAPHFPGCQIHPFGSSVTGLASKDSDVDIFVDLSNIMSPAEIDNSSSSIVFEAKKFLSNSYEFSNCIAIPKAKVPIVKCFHKSTKLSCDINFQNAFGIHNSNLITFYISLEPRLRTIIMILKHWAKINNLCGHGSLTSYALVMLLMYYLQQMPNPILPTVEKLQSICKTVIKIQDWECHFECDIKDCSLNSNSDVVLKVLMEFFTFYSAFNFEQNLIIIKTASAVPKHVFANPPENSPCHDYKNFLEKANAQPINLNKVMCVLDPFVLNHNITANVGLRELNKFQIRCCKSAEVCQRMENSKASNLKPLFVIHPRQKKLKFPYLELWKGDGEVHFVIPSSSFNPNNSFENSKSEPNTTSNTGKLGLLIDHLKDIFEKVLRLELISVERRTDSSASEKQIQKVEGMEDVHADSACKELEPMTLSYRCYYHVWNGRNNVYKEFSFPSTMPLMEKEMHVTNYIVETFYKGSQNLQKVELKCIFVPIMDCRCLEVKMILCNGTKTFRQMITLLLTLLHKWLEK